MWEIRIWSWHDALDYVRFCFQLTGNNLWLCEKNQPNSTPKELGVKINGAHGLGHLINPLLSTALQPPATVELWSMHSAVFPGAAVLPTSGFI